MFKKSYALNYAKIVGYGRPLYDAEEEGGSASTNTTTSKGESTVNIELTVLKKGAKGEQVKALQRMLYAMNYKLGYPAIDGDFGANTETAVKAYQRSKGLTDDGIVGAKTWSKLLKG